MEGARVSCLLAAVGLESPSPESDVQGRPKAANAGDFRVQTSSSVSSIDHHRAEEKVIFAVKLLLKACQCYRSLEVRRVRIQPYLHKD